MPNTTVSPRGTKWFVIDAAAAGWCLAWVWVGNIVYDLVMRFQAPALRLQESSAGFSRSVEGVGNKLPSSFRGPFDDVGGAADSLSHAAQAQAETTQDIALLAAFVVAGLPILFVLLPLIPFQWRWWKEGHAAKRLSGTPGFTELMARRALVSQPLSRLASVSVDPVEDIEHGNFDALAKLEMRRLGLRPKRRLQESRPPS